MSDWTVERIVEVCKRECQKLNVEFDIPVKINGRLTSTFGRVCYYPRSANGVVRPKVLEISKELIETATDESIEAVIAHECAHYLLTVKSGERHGHDKYFKQVCAAIGCKNDKATTDVDRIVAKTKIYKYSLNCPNCGNIGNYHRRVQAVQHPELYYCKKCGSENLFIEQNF